MSASRRYKRSTINIDVDMDEVWAEISDDDLREEYLSRFKAEPAGDFDLLEEVRRELLLGKPNAAIALIDSATNAQRITETMRMEQYREAMAAAH